MPDMSWPSVYLLVILNPTTSKTKHSLYMFISVTMSKLDSREWEGEEKTPLRRSRRGDTGRAQCRCCEPLPLRGSSPSSPPEWPVRKLVRPLGWQWRGLSRLGLPSSTDDGFMVARLPAAWAAGVDGAAWIRGQHGWIRWSRPRICSHFVRVRRLGGGACSCRRWGVAVAGRGGKGRMLVLWWLVTAVWVPVAMGKASAWRRHNGRAACGVEGKAQQRSGSSFSSSRLLH